MHYHLLLLAEVEVTHTSAWGPQWAALRAAAHEEHITAELPT